jgi:hypothetical protein
VQRSNPLRLLDTGLATQPYSATEVDGWQHKLSRVSQNRAAVHRLSRCATKSNFHTGMAGFDRSNDTFAQIIGIRLPHSWLAPLYQWGC